MMSRDAINYQNGLTDDQLLEISLTHVRQAAASSKARTWEWCTRWRGFAKPSAANARYYDYDMPLSSTAESPCQLDDHFGVFHLFTDERGDLVVELDPDSDYPFAEEARAIMGRHGSLAAEFELFECIFTNGIDFFTIDQIGALSEAPAFGVLAGLPDWIRDVKVKAALWRHKGMTWAMLPEWYYKTDWSKSTIWTAIEYYQLRSPIDDLINKGRAIFKRAE